MIRNLHPATVLIRCYIIACLFTGSDVYASDPPAELLQYTTEVVFDGKEVVTTRYREIRINNPEGDIYGEIEIPYSDMERLSGVKAAITDDRGEEIRKVRKKEMSDKSSISSISFYEDNYIREFVLKHNRYPYRIRYSYTIKSRHYISLANWTPVAAPSIPTRSSLLRVTVPSTTNLRYKSQLVDPPNIREDEKNRTYTWSAAYEGEVEPEMFAPPVITHIPVVRVMPLNFYFDQPGSLETWKDFGNWVCDLNEGLDQLTPVEEGRIELYLNGVTGKREKLEKLYRRLQEETRYVNISLETGGLKPYPASYVSEKKYGDCKALTNYFKAVLGNAGIKSYYSLVYLGEKIRPVDTSCVLPQFNHAILMVPVDDDTLWVDCTSKAPLNYTGPALQSRKAFVVERDNSKFLEIPELQDKDVAQRRDVSFSLLMNDKVRGDFHSTFRGSKYQELLYYQKNLHSATIDYVMRNYFTAQGFDPQEHAIISPHPDSTLIALDVGAVSSNYCNKYGNNMIFNVLPISVPRFEKPANRVHAVQIDCPVILSDSFSYHLPAGSEFESAPGHKEVKSEFGSYCISSRIEDDCIVVEKSFRLHSGYIPRNKYESFYTFISNCISSENNSHIVFSTP